MKENKSNESSRTRLNSSSLDRDKNISVSPRIERPIPKNAPSYYPWNLSSFFNQLNYLKGPIHNGINSTNSNNLIYMFKPPIMPNSVQFKATKLYDKFNIDDLDDMQLDFNTTTNQNEN
jgi:hypothetical protein